jgi:hypothetical protein
VFAYAQFVHPSDATYTDTGFFPISQEILVFYQECS